MSLTQHSLSKVFPSMSSVDQQALTEDIKANGLMEPIVLRDGQVLDGWHRYQACLAAGVEPDFVTLDGSADPVQIVLSANLARRHLTASQRAAAVVACSEWRARGEWAPSARSTNAQLAEAADVSERTIKQAKTAQRAGLGDAVRDGMISAKDAEELALRDGESKTRDEAPEAGLDEDAVANYEAMTRILDSDDRLAAARKEIERLERELGVAKKLHADKSKEVTVLTREAARWKKQAKRSASCQACMTALERPL